MRVDVRAGHALSVSHVRIGADLGCPSAAGKTLGPEAQSRSTLISPNDCYLDFGLDQEPKSRGEEHRHSGGEKEGVGGEHPILSDAKCTVRFPKPEQFEL